MKKKEFTLADWKKLAEILDKIDFIIIVVDSRNPLGTFSKRLWKTIRKKGITPIIVLNKIDLIPTKIVFQWKNYLEKKFNAKVIATSATKRMGTLKLRKQLRDILRKKGKQKIIGLVAGVPKTGKSTIINILRGKHSATTSLYPGTHGYTKSFTLYRIESKIYIIDTPGVVPDVPDEIERKIRLHSPEKLTKPERLAAKIIERMLEIDEKIIEKTYKLKFDGDPYSFLERLAEKRGWIEKNTKDPIIEESARTIIRDYLSGKFPLYMVPPDN